MTIALARSATTAFTSEQWEPVSLTYAMPTALQSMFDKLAELSELPENWDTYGSQRIQPAAKKTASNLLWRVYSLGMPVPHLVPVSGGGIQMEWQQNKRELELEILPNGEILFLVVDENEGMQEGRVPHRLLPTLKNLADWLTK